MGLTFLPARDPVGLLGLVVDEELNVGERELVMGSADIDILPVRGLDSIS